MRISLAVHPCRYSSRLRPSDERWSGVSSASTCVEFWCGTRDKCAADPYRTLRVCVWSTIASTCILSRILSKNVGPVSCSSLTHCKLNLRKWQRDACVNAFEYDDSWRLSTRMLFRKKSGAFLLRAVLNRDCETVLDLELSNETRLHRSASPFL